MKELTMAAMQPVVQLIVVGASAGGIEALSTLVASLPTDFPAPLVIAQHLDPSRPSHLQSILARRTSLPVRTVADRELLENGVIYVVPADRHVSLDGHRLSLDQDGAYHPRPSIDLLFRGAAAVFGEELIAVVLSGLGSDGAVGARRVKEAGGTVVIQNPRTAPYPSMPQALAPTTVDVIADVDTMGPLLFDLLTGAYIPAGPLEDPLLRTFLAELRHRTGLDFTQYKEPTIQRRLQRRLMATGTHSLNEYRAYLDGHAEEYGRLVSSFLIKVTQFFRDAELFAHLRTALIPALVSEGRLRNKTLRFWSAGCATGEEAYSLALLVAEALGDELADWTVRIFATDLDGEAIDFARRGVYPATALEGVPLDLFARFIVAEDGACTVSKVVRSLLVFGEHDLGRRPPFPRIDLCLCRNALIYFTPELQQRVLQLFAFALRDGGYLVLGKTETTSPAPAYFAAVQPVLRLFERRGERLLLPSWGTESAPARARRPQMETAPAPVREREGAQQGQLPAEVLLLRLPVGIAVVDRRYDLQRLNGPARRLFGIHTEALGEDLMHQVRGLTPQDEHTLRAAIDAALRGETCTLEAVPSAAVEPGAICYLRIICRPTSAAPETAPPADRNAVPRPLAEGAATAVLVITDVTAGETARLEAVAALEEARREGAAQGAAARAEVARLESMIAELRETTRMLRAANEELAASNVLLLRANEDYLWDNEETQAAAEEVEMLNEELQATNEELETLNEEQQATNAELETTNQELRARQQGMQELAAILGSLDEAVLALDSKGRVAFTNTRFAEIFGAGGTFAAEDAEGRPLPIEATPQERARRGEAFQMTFTRPGAEVGAPRRWYEATGRTVSDDTSNSERNGSKGSVLVIRDITDRTLRQVQDNFLATVRHELQTPLTAIRAGLGLLEAGAGSVLGPDERRLLQVGQRNAERLRLLIADLLTAGASLGAGAETRSLRSESEVLDLRTVVTGAAGAVQLLLEEKKQTLELDLPVPLPMAGDALLLEQVVVNLLANAHRHTPPGTRVIVTGWVTPKEVRLAVHDTGPGIPADALERIFERFQGIGRISDGTGLGLAIARHTVVLHGGRIWAESRVGQGGDDHAGATFHIALPRLATEEASMSVGADEDGAQP